MRLCLPLAVLAALALPASADAAGVFVAGGQYPVGQNPYGVVPADFNGDGRTDVAVINGTSSTASFYLGQGDGAFVKWGEDVPTDPEGAGGPNWAVARDFTGDDLIDLAVSNYVTSRVTILQQVTAGAFQSLGVFSVTNPTGIVTADFNGDGLLDLAASGEGGSVTVGLRQPNGRYALETPYAAGTRSRNLATGDFNGDRRPDLAVANEGSGNVTVLLRNAAGTAFAEEGTEVAVGRLPSHLAAADFNGDGRTDLAVSNFGSDSVQLLLRNAADAGFDAGLPVPVVRPIGLATADFDGDGATDLAVARNSADGGVTVLSRGTTPDTAMALQQTYGVAAADFNGDGRPDLAASSDSLNRFAVFLNTPPAQPPPPPPPPGPTPTPTPPSEPVAGRTVNATPVEGTVKVKLPGSKRSIDLAEARLLPIGTTVDARRGVVQITAAGNGGTARFFAGVFKISSQTAGRRPLTTLTLTEPLSCPKRAAAAAKKKSRKLWGDGKGAFRTRGRYSAATVRGTKWLVTDRCTTTTTRVTQGSVSVRDFVRQRTRVVRAGKSYTARRRG